MEIGQIRQGDIFLDPCDVQPPADAEHVVEIVLAEGEVTGHAHRLRGNVIAWNIGEQRYVRVEGAPGEISHEDHDPTPAAVVAPEVTYRVVSQHEWSLEGQWRKVAD